MPTDAAEAVFRVCITNYRDEELRKRLKSAAGLIARAESDYRRAGEEKRLHAVPKAKAIGDVSADEMVDVYDNKFVKKGAPGRHFYEKLRAATRGGKCPLCGQRIASTLDHHLPKTNYPSLAVTPINLIPVCAECNFIKRNETPRSDSEQTLHPYFDDIENEQWLAGLVIEGDPPAVLFEVKPPKEWDERTASRVKYHFKTFCLDSLYAKEAATELAGIKVHMTKLRKVGGPDAVRCHLLDAWESRSRFQVNSWQTALYKALADSSWYCETVGAEETS